MRVEIPRGRVPRKTIAARVATSTPTSGGGCGGSRTAMKPDEGRTLTSGTLSKTERIGEPEWVHVHQYLRQFSNRRYILTIGAIFAPDVAKSRRIILACLLALQSVLIYWLLP